MAEAVPTHKGHDYYVWSALLIALAVLGLRLSLIKFPTDVHRDEPIIASLMERAVQRGALTANWDGFSGKWWSRPTYQFSPYTLLQSAVAQAVHRLTGWPSDQAGYILLARVVSCCWAGAALLLVFFAAREFFPAGAALLAECTLALSMLHVQDSIYARVDAFVCFLVLLCLLLAIQAARGLASFRLGVLLSLCAGITVAAKPNTFPVLLLLTWVPCRWAYSRAISWRRALLLVVFFFFLAGLGVLIATPEILWQPTPFVMGLQYEFKHYTEGQIPHQAHGWEDNNLFYWCRYLVWLGLGLLQTAAALFFTVRVIRLRRWEDLMLGAFLLLAVGLILATRVRFERNLEICLGALAIAAAGTAWTVVNWGRQRLSASSARLALLLFLALWFAQPLRTLYDFTQALGYRQVLRAQVASVLDERKKIEIICTTFRPKPSVREYPQVLLLDYGDPFSAEGVRQWRRFLGIPQVAEFRSPWSQRGYPFSTVDTYHGPPRVIVLKRPASNP
jgi:hypothetical protein